MSGNKNLQRAKDEKNGEYYTEYNTISDEMKHYQDQLKGQIVYCNCDDPTWSNFWKYFHNNFTSLGLKKLISTHYQKDTELSYAMIYEGGDDLNIGAGEIVEIHGNTAVVNGKEVFYTAGDFRSDACIKYLIEATLVVTNPPFSLFREYMSQLLEYEKKFIIIGNMNAITYKEIFPLIKTNQLWLGARSLSKDMYFDVPDEYKKYLKENKKEGSAYKIINGDIKGRLASACWFTNLDLKKRHNGLWHHNGVFDNSQAHCYYEGNENHYPTYDNYNAVEVSKTKDVPIDYDGVMGVPITFLDKFNPEEFEILGITDRQNSSGLRTKKYTATDHPKYNDLNARSVIVFPDGTYKPMYARILIRNLHPIKKSDDLGYSD